MWSSRHIALARSCWADRKGGCYLRVSYGINKDCPPRDDAWDAKHLMDSAKQGSTWMRDNRGATYRSSLQCVLTYDIGSLYCKSRRANAFICEKNKDRSWVLFTSCIYNQFNAFIMSALHSCIRRSHCALRLSTYYDNSTSFWPLIPRYFELLETTWAIAEPVCGIWTRNIRTISEAQQMSVFVQGNS